MRKLTYWLVGLALIGVAIGAVLLLNNIQEITWQAAENAVCEATVADLGGADINSAFRFTFEGDVSANAVRHYLTVEPAVELNFHQGLQAREVLVVPVEPLQPGTVYCFQLATERDTLSWAFQTKREWLVQSVNPTHTATAVSLSAPVEIYFNQSLSADIAVIADYLEISPATEGRFEQTGNCLRFMPDTPWAADTVYTVRLSAGLPSQGSDIALAEDFIFAFETATADGSSFHSAWNTQPIAQAFLPSGVPSFSLHLSEGQGGGQSLTASLYRYADANAYAAELLERLNRAPLWSMQGSYPRGASTESLTWLTTLELALWPEAARDYRFSWPHILPPGCYMLKINYQGQSRDIRFQVSGLTAFAQGAEGQGLVWAHDAAAGVAAADCAVTYVNNGQETRTDANGLARMTMEREFYPLGGEGSSCPYQDIYLLRYGEQELVVTDNISFSADAQGGADIWQYVVLDKEIYQSGDTLEFCGYMRRRDNNEWDWNRVSVYICAREALGVPVLQDYAPLTGNIFRGSIELPRLLDGAYELQIWQSGQMLLAQSFAIGVAQPQSALPSEAEGELSLRSDKAAYALNESYTLTVEGRGQSRAGYLFLKGGGGLKEAVVEENALHHSVFGAEDFGGAYWRAVAFDGENYQATALTSLAADSSVYALQIEAETREQQNRAEGGQAIVFTVQDVTKAAPSNAKLLALVASPGLAMEDMLAALYAPNRASGLTDWPLIPPAPVGSGWPVQLAYTESETLFFDTLELDKNGQAELQLSLPPGEWQLYAWAVADDAQPRAGSTTLLLAQTGQLPANTLKNYPADTNEEYLFWATRYDISEDNSHFIRDGLLFFSSAERVQAMELLWQSLSSDNVSVEQRLSTAYARLLWQKHGYTNFVFPEETVAPELSVLQQPDGCIAAYEEGHSELLLSMLAASLARQGMEDFDTAALARYLQGWTTGAATPQEKAMALAGLSALGQPVLQELKLLLAQEGQTPYSRACLIWGLTQAGDLQVAKSFLYDLLDAYASDATSGSFYLEGGQGENIRLNRVGAMLSAACGEARTAFALLQYLQQQQQCDELTITVVAGELLSRLYVTALSAVVSIDGHAFTVETAAFDDLWLEQPAPANLLVEETEGDLAMTCLRFLIR